MEHLDAKKPPNCSFQMKHLWRSVNFGVTLLRNIAYVCQMNDSLQRSISADKMPKKNLIR